MSISPNWIEHLNRFDPHFLNLNGHRCHYLDEGEGDPIVMLHGNPTWSFLFRNLVESLRDSYRIVAPDYIGCGLSDKPDRSRYDYTLSRRVLDLELLLEQIGVASGITLVLHDWGGLIGMAFATRHPSQVRRFIIFNSAGFLLPAGKSLHWSLRFCKRFKVAEYLIRRFNAFVLVVGLIGCRQKKLSKEIKAAYKAPYDSWRNRVAIQQFVNDIPLSPRDRSYPVANEVDQRLSLFRGHPFLICWGEKDFVFDADFLSEWLRRFPQAEVHRFAQAGHNVVEDAGEMILPLIREFLLQHRVGSQTQ
jgi:haloalkane dehalogenase